MNPTQIEIYQLENGKTEIAVMLENDTVWLTQKQMSDLFGKDTDTIGLHLKNIYHSGELDEASTTEYFSVVKEEGKKSVKRKIKHYNFDAILSVGYSVNSIRGVQFRKWASNLLKEYLIKGFSINEKRLKQQSSQLKELQESVKILGNILNERELSTDESTGLLRIISDYAYALETLDKYDYQTLKIEDTTEESIYQLTYEEAMIQINIAKKSYGNSDLFGREKDDSFKSSVAAIYQTFSGIDL